MSFLLKIRNLSTHYGKIRALDAVSMHIWEGEIVSLIGANGAGKSTLLNSISGIVGLSSGSIVFNDREISKRKPEEIVNLGISQVPEGRQIFDSFTVYDNIMLGAYLRRKSKEKKEIQKNLRDIFDLFPILEERKKQRAGTLSGGEQQMLAIARGLMAKPRLLMLDEPSLGLAPKITTEIMNVIKDLKNNNLTILLVEQNARAALKISDRGYVFETGNVLLEGRGEELLLDGDVKRAYLGRDYKEFWE
ncbi:MAG: ABC transporter ATP-binding protein [Deltaproteobacteria bacterium]|uniref:ABC transporter ATP-binding protein n=1 Tax=Candidatus Zymogenus saltonus TaxID=2844893 RepID=A0A9D8KGP4_9DELT|nr:ABC transporter ATP-binding protein [Candidatus Zymogenus saltonus]